MSVLHICDSSLSAMECRHGSVLFGGKFHYTKNLAVLFTSVLLVGDHMDTSKRMHN